MERGYPLGRDLDKDGYSNTLADVAYKYWKTDLRADLADKVPTSTVDPANWQHLVNFTVGLGVNRSLNPANGIPNNWPNPHDPDDKGYKNATYIPGTRSMICGTRHSTAGQLFQRGRPRHLCCSPEQHPGPDRGP